MEILTANIVAVLTQWVWPIFLFIFGLGAVVFVHELGHFLVAKFVGIKVERFAIGFGPRIFGYQGKETDYSIMLLPLGGYVKMLGQEDFAPLEEGGEAPDPRSYNSKSVGARFAVISAGVIMNVIFAAVMFVIIGMVGMPVQAPVIGNTVSGYPAHTAQITWVDESLKPIDAESPEFPKDQLSTLQPGDRMKTIDGDGLMLKLLGRDVTRFIRVLMQAALSDADDVYTLGIERNTSDGKVLRGKVTLGLKMGPSPSGSGGMLPAFGIIPASSTSLIREKSYVPIELSLFKNKDKIVAINGQEVEHYWDLEKVEKSLSGGPVTVTVERIVDEKTTRVDIPAVQPMVRSTKIFYLKDGEIVRGKALEYDKKNKTITLQVTEDGEKAKRTISFDDLANTSTDSDGMVSKELLDILGMIPRTRVAAVGKGSPAEKAGMIAGDIIAQYGNHTAPTHLKLKELNKKFAKDGAEIVIIRDNKKLPPQKIKPNAKRAVIGIIVGMDMQHLVVGGVRENSPAADCDIKSGDVIEKINGQDITTWPELLAALSELQGKDVTLTFRRGDNQLENTIPTLSKVIFDKDDYTHNIASEPWRFVRLMDPKVSRGASAALAWGGRETMFFITTSYATLRSLVNQTVSTKDISGPVGIGSMAIQAGRRGIIDFAYFMAMISVSLAVINFLPFPVVDGGHAMFLIIEKIRGKPLSIRVMNVVQMIGLAMILMVFLFVTWQDISRLLG